MTEKIGDGEGGSGAVGAAVLAAKVEVEGTCVGAIVVEIEVEAVLETGVEALV